LRVDPVGLESPGQQYAHDGEGADKACKPWTRMRRWHIEIDTMRFEDENRTNPYAYALNNPIKYVDVTGLTPTVEELCLDWQDDADIVEACKGVITDECTIDECCLPGECFRCVRALCEKYAGDTGSSRFGACWQSGKHVCGVCM